MAAIKALIVHGGLHHPYPVVAKLLKEAFEEDGFARCEIVERDKAFNLDLSTYDVVVLYCQGGKLSDKQERNLCRFVESGGGLVGFHSANASFKENERFLRMIGSRFSGHAPGLVSYQVDVANPDHPLAGNLKPISVTDEFYHIEPTDGALDVLLTAFWQGKAEPMAYTRTYGKGHVFYAANGHDDRTFRNAEYIRLARRGLAYAAGRWSPVRQPIQVGILGYGGAFNMGKHHADSAVSTGGFQVIAVSDLDPSRRRQAEVELPGVKTYASQRAMLKNDDVQMVINITPHNVHAPTCLEALNAGRHVAVEKPFCTSQKEADAMITAAKRNKVMLAVYQSRRWDHHFLTAHKLVSCGTIGHVFETQIDFGGYGHPGTWWRSDKKISGGVLFDWGAHAIDWMLHIIPRQVVGVSGYFQPDRVWHMCTNEDHARVLIRFDDGSVANFSNSQINASGGVGWVILGTGGAIRFPTVFDQEATVVTFPHGKRCSMQVPCEPSDWNAFYRNVYDHLHHGLPLICRGEKSARVIGIIETAEKSYKAGRELPFRDVYFGK